MCCLGCGGAAYFDGCALFAVIVLQCFYAVVLCECAIACISLETWRMRSVVARSRKHAVTKAAYPVGMCALCAISS